MTKRKPETFFLYTIFIGRQAHRTQTVTLGAFLDMLQADSHTL